MKRRFALAGVLALVLSQLLMVAALASPDSVYNYAFDKTLVPWKAAGASSAFVTDDSLKLKADYAVIPVAGIPIPPNGYAALHQHPAEPVWMLTSYQTSVSRVDVTVDMKDFGGCVGCIPLVYVGTSAPTSLAQFKTDYESLLASRWSTHSFKFAIPGVKDPPPTTAPSTNALAGWTVVFVAITYTRLDMAGYGKDMYVGIDNVKVRLYDEWLD